MAMVLNTGSEGASKQKAPTPAKKTEYELYLESLANGQYNYPSVGNYSSLASQLLGSPDFSGFNALRQSAQSSYNLGNQALDTSYKNLLANLEARTKTTRQELASNRGTIMEDSFTRNRDTYRNLASRGLGASGLSQLGDIQNRMETGKQVSQVAGQYYKTDEALGDAEQQGTQAYQQQQQSLANALQANLAQVQQNEISYKNAYQQQVASVALQLQQQAQAAASANYQTKMSAIGELAKYRDTLAQNQPSESAKFDIIGMDQPTAAKIALWADTFGVTPAQAATEVKTYEAQYEQSLKNDAMLPVLSVFANAEKPAEVDGAFLALKDIYESADGAITKNDIKSFIQQNYGSLNTPIVLDRLRSQAYLQSGSQFAEKTLPSVINDPQKLSDLIVKYYFK